MEKTEWDPSHVPRARQKGSGATRSRPYLRRDSSRRPGELWGPGEPGGSGGREPHSSPRAIDTSLLRGDEGVSSRVGLVLQGEELVRPPGSELGLWICDTPDGWPL